MSWLSAGGVEGRGKTWCGGGDGSEEAAEHQRVKSAKHKAARRKHKGGKVGGKISDEEEE